MNFPAGSTLGAPTSGAVVVAGGTPLGFVHAGTHGATLAQHDTANEASSIPDPMPCYLWLS